YYNIHRILLSLVGLWPYQQSNMRKVQWIISSIVLASSIIIQFMKFLTTEYSLDLLLKVLSFAVPCMVFVLKYVSFYIGSETVRYLMESIISDWNSLKIDIEIEIIKKHSDFGRLYALFFTLAVYSGLFFYMLIQFLPNFLDIIASRNESRLHNIPLTAEYFADQQKYYLPILLHVDIIALVGFTIVISTESLITAYIRHAIGMFEVARYRIERALNASTSISPMLRENMIHIKIIDAIEIHQRTIEFFEYLSSTFSLSYFILMILGVISLSLNLFRLFQVAILPDQKKNLASFVIFVSGHFCYMFICNYLGQKIIDNSTEIYNEIYNTQWYAAPIKTQKLLLFIMQRSIKSCKLVLGGIYYVSVENFTTLASMSLSYFTVLYSMQK
ncbi:LOW QUALITY PROTEIN: uncharacterized protein LOC105423399, partial [Pogonomyrmex barbatus]|uniref:Odorant receptor n=1 Tax=Pogonomyrmex barbatus TaxID=144034 RepID=A0A8N1S4Z8_9HYME